jgi:hypothetical protein
MREEATKFLEINLCIFLYFGSLTCCVTQAGLKLMVLLSKPSKYRLYRHVPQA